MEELIKDFLDEKVIDSLSALLSADGGENAFDSAAKIATAFGSGELKIGTEDEEKRLVTSFRRNLSLLVEKTWVEQYDVSLKEEVLYKLEKFCEAVLDGKWHDSYETFIKILNNVIYLMFGSQSRTPDFGEYALRIDPEFGIFCWYVRNLPETNDWSDEKSKAVESVAMFFLANY